MNPKISMKARWKVFRANFNEAKKDSSGFTLLDIMVSMIIIGLLGVVAMSLMAGQMSAARKAKGLSDAAPEPVKTAPAPQSHIDFPWEVILGVGLVIAFAAGAFWGAVFITNKVKAANAAIKKNLLGWKTVIENHNRIRSEWMAYETDLLKMIDYPMLTDMAEPVTIELHKALKNAILHSPKGMKGLDRIPFASSEYAAAVSDLDTAWQVAESKAKLANWSKFDLEEQKRLRKAKDLLNLAMNSGATGSERQVAYKAALKTLKGLIHAPEKTLLSIEEKIRLAVAA